MNKHEIEHERDRRKVWIRVAGATAGANDCKHSKTVIVYADAALEAFDRKFYSHNLNQTINFSTTDATRIGEE